MIALEIMLFRTYYKSGLIEYSRLMFKVKIRLDVDGIEQRVCSYINFK